MIPPRSLHFGLLLHGLVKNGPVEIGKPSEKAGHLCIDERRLLAKYDSSTSSPWSFTFRPQDIRTLVEDYSSAGLFGNYVCLICGSDSICVLRSDEVFQLLSTEDPQQSQTIRVRKSKGCCLRVSGSEGQLEPAIAANRFPDIFFQN